MMNVGSAEALALTSALDFWHQVDRRRGYVERICHSGKEVEMKYG